jgi:biotin synthase
MTASKLEYICSVADAVKKEEPELNIIACNGTATVEDMLELKVHGVGSYNHNLESSENYYRQICSTHTWKERYQTCLNAKEAGLNLCSGGIFGMGESQEDRLSLIASLKELQPSSIAMNFFHPNEALPIKSNSLDIEQALNMIRYTKEQLSNSRIMVAGGREKMFASRVSEIFEAGANSIVIGDYLTTSGEEPNKDILMLESLGLDIAKTCDGK